MNFTYNSNKIYNNWIQNCKKFFSKWKDADFYSDKAEHIYFYSEVTDESVNKLHDLLKTASKTKKNGNISKPPKPIVIHLNSPGGSTLSENLFSVVMSTQRVPLCVVIESLCASAATTLALLAPYRIMIDYSSYMIHDMSGTQTQKGHEKISATFTQVYDFVSRYLSLVRERTGLSEKEIKKFISRDIYIDSNYCKKKKIIDRILKFPKINTSKDYNKSVHTELSLKLPTFLKKTNLNHLYVDTVQIYDGELVESTSNDQIETMEHASTLPEICIALDKYILHNNDNIIKPILIHFKPSIEFYLHTKCNPLELVSLQYRIALIQQKTPVVAMIEGPQALDNLGLILMCPIRLMMTPTIISSYFTYNHTESLGYGHKTIDILENTKYNIKNVIKFLKKFSKLPVKFYTELQHEIINLKPEDCMEYGLVHQVVNFMKIKQVTLKNMQNYYKLNNLTQKFGKSRKR